MGAILDGKNNYGRVGGALPNFVGKPQKGESDGVDKKKKEKGAGAQPPFF